MVFIIFVLTIPALTYCPGGNPSIVGADAFHFSVRNGKRWCHIAQKTESLSTNYILICQNALIRLNLLFAFSVLFEHGSKSVSWRTSSPNFVWLLKIQREEKCL